MRPSPFARLLCSAAFFCALAAPALAMDRPLLHNTPPTVPSAARPVLTPAVKPGQDTPANPAQSRSGSLSRNDYFINLGTIRRVECDASGGGGWSGSAEIIARNRVVTAGHVAYGASRCTIDGQPLTFINVDNSHDFAVAKVDLGDTPIMPISCEGFVKDAEYLSIGYAKGQDFAVTKQISTGKTGLMQGDPEYPFAQTDFTVEIGVTYPGMSGGAVIGLDGRMVGLVNAGDDQFFSMSQALKDTALCAALREPPVVAAAPVKKVDAASPIKTATF